jgi:hypothetical protein
VALGNPLTAPLGTDLKLVDLIPVAFGDGPDAAASFKKVTAGRTKRHWTRPGSAPGRPRFTKLRYKIRIRTE